MGDRPLFRTKTRPKAYPPIAGSPGRAVVCWFATLVAACSVQGGDAIGTQSNGLGPSIGFIETAEHTFHCRGNSFGAATACAIDQCRPFPEAGCEAGLTEWCAPAKWAGTMVVWSQDLHHVVPACGQPTEDALLAALELRCNSLAEAERCEVALIIDPSGYERNVWGSVEAWRGPAAP